MKPISLQRDGGNLAFGKGDWEPANQNEALGLQAGFYVGFLAGFWDSFEKFLKLHHIKISQASEGRYNHEPACVILTLFDFCIGNVKTCILLIMKVL